jgi:hypothetical protein
MGIPGIGTGIGQIGTFLGQLIGKRTIFVAFLEYQKSSIMISGRGCVPEITAG